MTDPLANAKRIVVKVGSSLLIDSAAGALKRDWLESLAGDVAELKRERKKSSLSRRARLPSAAAR